MKDKDVIIQRISLEPHSSPGKGVVATRVPVTVRDGTVINMYVCRHLLSVITQTLPNQQSLTANATRCSSSATVAGGCLRIAGTRSRC